MNARLLLLLLVVLLTAIPVGTAISAQDIKVGVYPYEPLIKVENWKMTGVCIDIIEHIAQAEDWNIEYVHGSRQQCIDRLATGQIDLLAAIPFDVSEVADVRFCQQPVVVEWGQVYTHYSSSFNHFTDLQGKTVAVLSGDNYGQELVNQLDGYRIQAKILEVGAPEDILRAIHDREADAGILRRTFGSARKGQFNVTESPISVDPVEIGFAVPANRNTELATTIDHHLHQLKQEPNSAYHRALNRWMGVPTDPVIPAWLVWGLAIAAGLLILLGSTSFILRRIVRKRTSELLNSNRELQSEISERQRVEEALIENQNRYRELVDNIEEGLVLVDAHKRIRFANPSAHRIFGVSDGELIDRSLREFNIPDIFERRRPFGNPRRRTRYRTTTREVEILRRDGSRRNVVITASPRFDDEGEFAGFFGPIRDVTELKQAEQEHARLEAQVRQSQKLESLGIMAGGIAHDFNNLLMGITGYADLIELDMGTERDVSEHIQGIKTGARRAGDLCQQLLAYSGKGKFVIEPLDISLTVQEMAHLLEVSISKKIAIDYRLSPGLPAIEGDATQIRQIVMNLITNAADSIGDEAGVVTISTGLVHCDHNYLQDAFHAENLPTGNYIYLDVKDTGCGMHETELGKIFDPFYTTKFAGRGLGLAAVLGIVRGHKGAIRINSRVGTGTTFRILLPCSNAQVPVTHSEPAAGRDWRGGGKILLAEDEVSVRLVTKRMLKRLGFEVLTAGDGFEAVKMFKENAADLKMVMLDLTMPVMDGEEAFLEIRQIKPDIPIIIASGYSEHEVTARFTGRDLAGFVQKPYEYHTLQKRIKEVLGDSGAGDA